MQLVDQNLRLSPSDLSGFLACRHRTGLDLAVAHDALAKPAQNDAFLQSMRDRGIEHERAYVDDLRAQGFSIVEISTEQAVADRAAATLQAMNDGAEVIVQAALMHGQWGGYADVLRRVPRASALGAWSYEPCDTKLARETRGGTILQLAVYADLLERLQGLCPEHFHVVTPGLTAGDFITHTYRFADYAAYYRVVRRQLSTTLALGHDEIQRAHYPEPVEHCDVCRWSGRCNGRRRADDHLSFIAGAARLHRDELTTQGFPTLAAVAAMPVPVDFTPARGSRDTFERIAHQARLQLQQRTTNQPVHELLPFEAGKGLGRLPEPSPGDIFLDLEGARFAREGGREYLFGIWSSGGYPVAASVDFVDVRVLDASLFPELRRHYTVVPQFGPPMLFPTVARSRAEAIEQLSGDVAKSLMTLYERPLYISGRKPRPPVRLGFDHLAVSAA